ncbi:MAG: hypothetical protein HOP19_23490, partial [Acidobacteria bacterium]|nr:hypothetical protein [Acidobacteriota bacterium]
RLCRVLWHCYFDPTEPSQLAIAELVGVSDSSVGDYRRKVEYEMRQMRLSFAQVAHFTDALREELRVRLFSGRVSQEPVGKPVRAREIEVPAASFTTLLPLLVVPATPHRFDYAMA